jgi:hypothetical protein
MGTGPLYPLFFGTPAKAGAQVRGMGTVGSNLGPGLRRDDNYKNRGPSPEGTR